MKKVVFIAGTAFCGSSLLNILLDTQNPTIRGLGERSQTQGEAGGPCVVCKNTVKKCQLYSQWDGNDFYEFNFKHYGCSTLVDSSKRTDVLLHGIAQESQFTYFVLHMSKNPHATAHSFMKHWKYDTWAAPEPGAKHDITEAFEAWITLNQLYLDETHLANVEAVKHVHYDTLARNPSGVVEEICQWLGEPFDRERLQKWRSPTTHILGGNPAILMQVLTPKALPGRKKYLGGKYADKRGQIFVDAAWARDRSFLTSAIKTYDHLSAKLDPLLAALQYGNSAQMIADCEQMLSENLSQPEAESRGMFTRIWDYLTVGKAA